MSAPGHEAVGGGVEHFLKTRFASPLAVYGLMVYTVLIGVVADDYSSSGRVFLETVIAQVVLFGAHVFAHTLGEHGEHGLRHATRRAVRTSSAMLYGPIPSAVVLGIGALVGAAPETLVELALLTSTIVLFILGYLAYSRRTSKLFLRIAGALGTALFGLVVIIVEYAVH